MAVAADGCGTDRSQSVAEDLAIRYHHSPPAGIEPAVRDWDIIMGSARMRVVKSVVGGFAILAVGAASMAAQTTAGGAAVFADSGTFLVRRGADTIATEEFSRRGVELQGRLLFKAHKFLSERYRAVVAPDATVPLVEVTVRNGPDSGTVQAKFSQRTRIVFRDDSVAIDDMGSRGLKTLVLGTERGAMPYLNLSFALLEQAVQRARTLGRTGAEVPFFNLSGTDRQSGQTVWGKITFLGSDSVAVGIGTVEFRLLVDPEGRLLGGGIPAQNLIVERTARRS
jgi:hypothetical protein